MYRMMYCLAVYKLTWLRHANFCSVCCFCNTVYRICAHFVAGLWAQPHHLAGMYLWNPFAIMSCVSGAVSPMENLSSLLAVYGAAVGNIPLAAFATACGAYLSLHPILLLVGIQMLLRLACE